MLNIPIQHVGKNEGRQLYRDVKMDNSYNWQRQHWRTLETAYRTSPYFEFYEDEIAPLFHQKHTFLLDFNMKTIETICGCLQIDTPKELTNFFHLELENSKNMRHLVDAKTKLELVHPNYVQVFGDRHGFVENASGLDLLFNEGTNALSYLQNIAIETLDA